MTETLTAALRRAAGTLRAAGIDGAMTDVRILIGVAAGLSREDMLRDPDRALPDDVVRRFDDMIRRRADREPVSRILGRREFRSLDFALGPDTLDPRPDSETLVETVLDLVSARLADRAVALRVLDLGTGTGCLLLSLLAALPDATGIGSDLSPAACAIARCNARALGLDRRAAFVACDWEAALAGRFDVVVSNPPYIASSEIDGLAPEVARHDPRRALDGGADGLDAYRAIAARTGRILAPGGVLALEIGSAQADSVNEIFRYGGYHLIDSRKDLGGHLRCLAFLQAGPAN